MSDQNRDCYNCTLTEDRYLCERCRTIYEFTAEGRMVPLRPETQPPVAERPQERPQPFTPEQVNEAIRWCDDAGGMFRTEFAPMLREFARLLAEREAQP